MQIQSGLQIIHHVKLQHGCLIFPILSVVHNNVILSQIPECNVINVVLFPIYDLCLYKFSIGIVLCSLAGQVIGNRVGALMKVVCMRTAEFKRDVLCCSLGMQIHFRRHIS